MSRVSPPVDNSPPSVAPTLLAQAAVSKSDKGRKQPRLHDPAPFFASAQWTADGTALVTGRSDHLISTFVLPDDLGQELHDGPRTIGASGSIQLPEATQTIAPSPYFTLNNPASQLVLAACRDHPIQLYQAFPESLVDAEPRPSDPGIIASYRLIQEETEAYLCPSSLLWSSPGTHFITGSTNRLDVFDVTRYGSSGGPILTIPTIPSKRHAAKGGGVGMKGNVSALAGSCQSGDGSQITAAGTWTRWIGLYDAPRSRTKIANWSVSGADDELNISLDGRGIVQTLWSPCGRYLVVNERHASGLLVYDIRVSGKLLGILNGRQGGSQQKLSCDVFQGTSDSTFEVWAGTSTGGVVTWQDVGSTEGILEPNHNWKLHNAPVASTSIHASGSVFATASGGWQHSSSELGIRSFDEASLRVWAVDLGASAEDP